MSKKILVAGGGGFIGGHLAKTLVNRGHEVRVVDIKPLDQWYQKIEGAENIVLTLRRKKLVTLQVKDVMKYTILHVIWEEWVSSKITKLYACLVFLSTPIS